jgi:hypothetical protein
MFDKNSESLIHWFENLEEKCQKLIYEKRESWFQNSLEEADIETAFNSLIRVYKSGKYYLVRTNIKSTRTDEPAVKIYNENEVSLTMSQITPETNIISILEIQGIKFTSRSFQIEIELKQVMALDNEPIFDNCLIKSSKTGIKQPTAETLDKRSSVQINPVLENIEEERINDISNDTEVNTELKELDISELQEQEDPQQEQEQEQEENKDSILNIDIEDLNEDTEPKELKEVNIDFSLENNEETMKLKKPNQVYFELYKQAREKAKQAKKSAIIAYLEAKNIKKTYMIENMNDSDSDFDAEIDEVSESELEQF